MDELVQIWVRKTTRAKLDKHQKSKKLRTRDDAVNSLLEGSK